jgi:hypothetical protein
MDRDDLTISQLIQELEAARAAYGDVKVMILDGFNAVGIPRDINFGPQRRQIEQEDADAAGDCEGRVGESILVFGYGCY